MAIAQRQKRRENEFENFVPTISNSKFGEHGSLQLNAYKPGYEHGLSVLGETLELVSSVLQKRDLFPLTQERLSRLDLSAASNIDVKFNKNIIKIEFDISRVGATPIYITAILSPHHDSITLYYGNGKMSHIDRNGRDMIVREV